MLPFDFQRQSGNGIVHRSAHAAPSFAVFCKHLRSLQRGACCLAKRGRKANRGEYTKRERQ